MNHFEGLEQIKAGKFRMIYKAYDRVNESHVALKKVNIARSEGVPGAALREISILKELDHPNIVQLFDTVSADNCVYIVLEYIPIDLKHYIATNKPLPMPVVKSFLQQLLKGIAYCHAHLIIHRDLSPNNILVERNGIIKISDFSVARRFSLPLRVSALETTSLWYCAPEILLGSKFYNTSVDIWSIGCVFAEMATSHALFPSNSQIDELFKIFRALGTPNETNWPGVSKLPYYNIDFPLWKPQSVAEVVPELDSLGVDVFNSLLIFDPNQRISACIALESQYFKDVQ